MPDMATSRRGVLRGSLVALFGAVAGYLAARGSAGRTGSAAANAYGNTPRPRVALAAAADVPAGGGLVVRDADVVLTRDANGDLHAFSAICTHQGCTVASVVEGTIQCPCHGSRFDATTGAVTRGPAARPLATVAVVVRAGKVYSS